MSVCLRIVFWDQLNCEIDSLKNCDPKKDIILVYESWRQVTRVKHHKKKIAFLLSATRHFVRRLLEKNLRVEHFPLDIRHRDRSLSDTVLILSKKHSITKCIATRPTDYHDRIEIEQELMKLPMDVQLYEDNRFLCTKTEFENWAGDRKQLRMEFFYREMRRKYQILMDDNQPLGGKWNLDPENRKPPKEKMNIPEPYRQETDELTQSVIEWVGDHFSDHFGDLSPFFYAVTRDQALASLDDFIEHRLPLFGSYQDAMIQDEPWMYHSHIGFYLNCGLLMPTECIQKAEKAFHDGHAPLNSVEGFIRQILGWREYIRGIYLLKMPDYEKLNALNADRNLPMFYWTGETKMNCISQCIKQTKEHAYAHHIQRLMVLGNFALIAGLSPDEVNEWYHIVYADAFHWVELPNVTGMILFADGGILGSKPYAASGAYINKMSNYCKSCSFKVAEKSGDKACPFNYLYWDFLLRHQEKFEKNPRMAMIYRTLFRFTPERISEIKEDAQKFFDAIEH